jgi:hypothetical protein
LAVAKQAVTQRSFILGQPREEFLEAADLDLADNSLRLGENVRIKATRTVAQRHGTEFLKTASASAKVFEIRPADGLTYGLEITTLGQVRVLDDDAATVWSGAMSALTTEEIASLWVEGFSDLTVIGTSARLRTLTYSGGTFTLGNYTFDAAPGDELAQPYWAYTTGISLTPSANTGAITVTASAALFSAAWIGMRIRYLRREILITAYTSPTQVSGTVQSQLPPTFRLTLSTTAGFKVGDTVVGQTTDYRGYIIAVSGLDIDVLTLDFFDGPDAAEKISAPSGSATLTAKATIAAGASPIWDEPLISPVRGYPRSGAGVSGRLVLCDFPAAPDAVAISSARSITDFRVGDEDDDAIARAFGDNRPRFLHVVNAGDILLFADKGCYLINLRDGTLLSPATVNVIAFDARGATSARPAKVDGGVVFIEAGGSALAAATLSGDFYSKWRVRTLSTYHDQLFAGPLSLAGPPPNCTLDDKYLFVVNADGGMTVMSWVDSFDVESVGFVPWTTDGDYKAAVPIFGGYWFQTSRVGLTLWERLASNAIMDCEMPAATVNSNFNKKIMHVAGDRWYAGTTEVDGGTIPELADLPADAKVGFNFVSRVMQWPKKQIQHPKAGLLECRVIRFAASVLSTGPVQIRANAITQNFGGYSFGDDLSEPAPEMTKIIRVSVVGRRVHPELEIIKPYPGRMQILSMTQEVSY